MAGPLMILDFLSTLAMPIIVGVCIYRLLNRNYESKAARNQHQWEWCTTATPSGVLKFRGKGLTHADASAIKAAFAATVEQAKFAAWAEGEEAGNRNGWNASHGVTADGYVDITNPYAPIDGAKP